MRQTFDLVLPALKTAPKVVNDARLYEADADTLLQVAMDTPPGVASLLMVGHNPGLADFAMLLIGSGDAKTRARLNEKFPTTALAVIDFPFDAWEKLRPKSGRIERFVVPRALKGETD